MSLYKEELERDGLRAGGSVKALGSLERVWIGESCKSSVTLLNCSCTEPGCCGTLVSGVGAVGLSIRDEYLYDESSDASAQSDMDSVIA